jgi:oligosaccharide repeat unit polymerase
MAEGCGGRVFVALLLLVLTLVVCFLNRGIINPISITLAVLTLSTGLASLRLFGLYDFDSIAAKMIVVGSVSVFAGAVLAQVAVPSRARSAELPKNQDDLIRYSWLNFALAASIVAILIARWQQLQILATGGTLADVRISYLGYGGLTATVDLLDRVLVGPVATVALPIFLWSVLRRRVNAIFGVLFICVVVLNQLTSGGRFVFLYAGVMILALLSRSGSLHLRTVRARVLFAILCVAIVVFTLARGNSLLFEAYTYLSVPVPLLAHWTSAVDDMNIQTFGGSFFYGILTLLFRLSEAAGHPIGSDVSMAVALPQEYWVELLPGRYFNAFVTMFYYFFLDFRWVGVVAGGVAWGLIGQSAYRRMWTSSLRATFFGLLMLQVAIMTFVRWEFSNGSLVIGLFMLLLFVKSQRVRRKVPSSVGRDVLWRRV